MSNNDWYEGVFRTIDAMDVDAFVSYITEDGTFRYGSGPAVQGAEAIRDFVTAFFSSIAGLTHTIDATWEVGDDRFIQGTVTYQMPDGRDAVVPFLNLFRMEGEKIREYLVYADPSPMAG